MGNRRDEILGPDKGSEAAANGKFSLITAEKLHALYKNLLKCRMLIRQPGSNGVSGAIRGHEAALVGATIDLGMGDAIWFHEHGLLTGLSPDATIIDMLSGNGNRLAGAVQGTKAANRNGASGSSHAHAAIGTALANKTTLNKKVALVFSNDESRAIAGEALHIAAVHSLPMVFVHQADGESTADFRTSEREKKPAAATQTPWFPHIAVDRDDVVAIYRVASESISRARLGRGPTLIECLPLPVSQARNGRHGHDPIRHMEHYLKARGLFDPK